MIGCARPGLVDDQRRRAARRPTASAPTTRAERPPALGGLDDPEHQRAHAERRATGRRLTSNRPRRRGVSTSTVRAPTIIATAIGTLTRNAARHDTRSVRAPPTSSPRLAPMPAVAAYQATARSRGLALEVRGDQRQRGRRDDRRTDALQGPGGDHPPPGGRERRSAATRAEDRQPDRRTAAVGRRCHRPGRRAAAARRRPACTRPAPRTAAVGEQVEPGADARQPGEDHRVVEQDHEVADQDDRQDRVPGGRRLPRAGRSRRGGARGAVTGAPSP